MGPSGDRRIAINRERIAPNRVIYNSKEVREELANKFYQSSYNKKYLKINDLVLATARGQENRILKQTRLKVCTMSKHP